MPPNDQATVASGTPRPRLGPVVVTGGSRGIGRAVAQAFAAQGRAVGLVARSRPDLEATLLTLGGHSAVAVADVGHAGETADAMATLARRIGPAEVLVCSAGSGAYGSVRSTSPEVIEQLLRANFLGAVHAVHAVLEGMVERRRGHIVLIGSVAGHIGVPLEAAYSASKFALAGWGEALGVEVARHGVAVTTISPGPVATGFFDARGAPYRRRRPRPMAPTTVAAAVVRAVDRPRAEVMLPRRLRVAVVVRAAAPSFFRRAVARSTRRALDEDHG